MSRKKVSTESPFHDLVDSRRAMRELGIARGKFYAAIADGEIRVTRMGSKILIPRGEVERIKVDGLSSMRPRP